MKGIQCPKCGDTGCDCVDSRAIENGRRRRYECKRCGNRFSTLEYVDSTYQAVMDVINSSRRLEKAVSKLKKTYSEE